MTIDEIIYDKEIEVSKNAYDKCRKDLEGIIVSREENGKYFVKLWFMKYSNALLEIINNN